MNVYETENLQNGSERLNEMANSLLARLEHKIYIQRKRRKFKNQHVSILASNCNGGIILHDLGLRFDTPTINLYFHPSDFIKFISDINYYLAQEPIEIESECRFPVGKLDDITVYFMHYSSFDEAKRKWQERKERIHKDNLFVMMTDQNGCTHEDMLAFDALPFPNKVIFTHRPCPEIHSAVYIKGFENNSEVGVLSDWKPGFWKRRWIDDFDYVSFLNH